jgi:hypothetical protein
MSCDFLEQFIDTTKKHVLIEYVRSAFANMQAKIKSKSDDSEFFFAEKADKALYEYIDTKTNKLKDCWQTKLYTEIIEDCNGDIKSLEKELTNDESCR